MKAVRFAMVVLFVLLFAGKPVWAEESAEDSSAVEAVNDESAAETVDEGAVFAETAVKPYEGFLQANDEIANKVDEMTAEVADDVVSSGDDSVLVTTEPMNEGKDDAAVAENPTEVTEPAAEEAPKDMADAALLDAIKADIKDRSKATGKLDLYDGTTNKVRTLDLIEFKPGATKDGETTLVRGDFRDTTSGDVVSMDIKVVSENGAYSVKDMTIASVAAPQVKEAKTDYTDEETRAFMQEYIDTQSQATGTFDLYDEKTQKMRKLQFVSLDEKLRRYGIIAIATAEFTDKDSGDVVKVDVNTENKNGLSVTAMRLKSVSKPAVKE